MAVPQELATRYEQLREQVIRGGGSGGTAIAVVVRQGLWAWIMLAAAEDAHGVPRPEAVRTTPTPSSPPPTVPRELLAAWTDLVVGLVARQEVSP
jgi:hypothetical protein